ncbi:hypothetical protein [Amycolatopsis sp.]|uniref:hypothetical protein n=1 Tax=Amycolatopsis sp. TaxID=37632 RepID=UPI00262704CE|nr:hypothetical protein [Amycolatopsis sp.]
MKAPSRWSIPPHAELAVGCPAQLPLSRPSGQKDSSATPLEQVLPRSVPRLFSTVD